MDDFPDFIIAGAAKSGTTSLSRYLNTHPQIYLPERELNFYPFMEKNPGYTVRNHPVTTNRKTYCGYFRNIDAKIKGEKSVSYMYPLYAPAAIRNIARIHPDPANLKILILLRHPVNRAFSQYVHNLAFYETLPFEEALKAWKQREKKGWVPAYDYLGAGMYYKPLKLYMQYFRQLRVYLFEELRDQPQRVMTDIQSFLGLEENHTVDPSVRFNVSKIPRNRLNYYLYQGLARYNPLKYLAGHLMSPERYQALKLKLTSFTHYKPKLSEDTRIRLMEYYKPEIKKLQELVDRELDHWMKP